MKMGRTSSPFGSTRNDRPVHQPVPRSSWSPVPRCPPLPSPGVVENPTVGKFDGHRQLVLRPESAILSVGGPNQPDEKPRKGRDITMSAELLEQAIALAQAGRQVKVEILDERRPIVDPVAA